MKNGNTILKLIIFSLLYADDLQYQTLCIYLFKRVIRWH